MRSCSDSAVVMDVVIRMQSNFNVSENTSIKLFLLKSWNNAIALLHALKSRFADVVCSTLDRHQLPFRELLWGNLSAYSGKCSLSNSTAAAKCPVNVNLSFALATTVSHTSDPIFCKIGAPPCQGVSGQNCAQIEATESQTFEIELTRFATILWVCTTSMFILWSCEKSVSTRGSMA